LLPFNDKLEKWQNYLLPWKILHNCAFGTFSFLFWFGSATVASSSQLGHAAAFPPFCFVLADNMNGVLYSAVSVRNRCLPLQKRAHWKMLIVKMQMSEKWHRKIVNQDIHFVVIVPAQTPTTFGYSSKKDRTSHC